MFHQLKPVALLALALMCLMSCQSVGKKSHITIQTRTLKPQFLQHNDKFGDKKMNVLVRDSILNENDHFPKFYTFMVDNMMRAVYVRPKNKRVVIVDRTDSLGFEGITYPDETIILQELNRRFSVFLGYTLGLWRRSHDLRDAYLSSKKIYEEEQAYLKQAFKQFKTGRDFRKALRREIRYSYICNLIGPYSIKEVNVDSISPEYVKTVNGLQKELRSIIKTRSGTDKNVQLMVYDYNRFLSRKTRTSASAFDYEWQSAEQHFKGETQEYLMFRLLKEHYGAIKNYAVYLEKFKTTCKDKDFITHLNDFAAQNTHNFTPAELACSLSDSTGKILTWADILAQNKGKNIYLVNSAHASFTFFGEKLAAKIADFEKNNTKIIFVSSDRNKEKWLKELKTADAKLFQHYHLAAKDAPLLTFSNKKEETSRFFYNILIDDTGKVVLSNAADANKFDVLMRQLQTLSKIVLP